MGHRGEAPPAAWIAPRVLDRLTGETPRQDLEPAAAVVVYLARPGRESPGLSDEASEVRYFGPAEIPWDEIAFRTTDAALHDWVKLVAVVPRG